MLNSPSVPRSDTIISTGIWNGTASEAITFGSVAKPLVCISRMPRVPPIHAPDRMPSPSSSRATAKAVKNGSACTASISGRNTLSGT